VTHREIEEREIVEAYLQGKLPDNDAQAFEEHFFECDQCFAEVRAAGNFIAGVRQIAQAGSPRDTGESGRLPEARRWQPAFGFAWAAAALLIVILALIVFAKAAPKSLKKAADAEPPSLTTRLIELARERPLVAAAGAAAVAVVVARNPAVLTALISGAFASRAASKTPPKGKKK